MAKYVISYDLHAPTNNRTAVQDAIQSLGSWCKYVSTTYLVNSNRSLKDVQDICTKPLDGNDKMIIAEITGPICGFLMEKEWKWIEENI